MHESFEGETRSPQGRREHPTGARPAVGAERGRLWHRWTEIDLGLDGHAGLRTIETPVVILEPLEGAA